MGNNCNTGRCKPKAKATPKCTVPQAALTINKWSCDYPAGKKCSLVEYDGFVYGLNEDRLECSVLPPPADDGYTRAMDTATAIEWVAKCKGCCDKPEDIHITGFTIDGNTATITTNSGTYTQTITHPAQPADVYIDDIRVSDDGKSLIYHYTNGDEVTKPHPAGGGGGYTPPKPVLDCETGKMTLAGGDVTFGSDSCAPSIVMHTDYHQGGAIPNPTTPQAPTQGVLTSAPNKSWGGWVKAGDERIVPKTGLYLVDPRLQYNNAQSDTNHDNKIKAGLTVNGAYKTGVCVGSADDFGLSTDPTESREKTKPREVYLVKGDKVGIKYEPVGDAAKAPLLVGMYVRLAWQSNGDKPDD